MKRRARWSLASRLMAWYAATTFFLVAAAAFMQYRTLESQLDDDDQDLLVAHLEAARGARPDSNYVQSGPHESSVIVRRLDRQCHVISQSAGDPLPPPVCEEREDSDPQFRSWRSPKERGWLIASRQLGIPPVGYLEALLDRSRDNAVLASYREQLLLVLAGALLLATLVGYGIARRGLRPLAALRERVSRIDARSLDQRLGGGDAPAEIATLVASFDDMLDRLDAAFRALSELSAELAHELRTPLHVLRQQAEVALGRARAPEEYKEVLESSLEELDRLGRMADDILFLAKAEDPRVSIDRRPLDLAAELHDVVEYLEAVAADNGISVVINVPEHVSLEADHMLLRRALVNLVMNALRHTPPGGQVRLSAAEHDSAVVLQVEDTGEGIPPEALLRVFDRYYRGPGQRSDHSGGSGLGLAIVRGILQLHGGTAHISSQPGRGTCVTLTFPARSVRSSSN